MSYLTQFVFLIPVFEAFAARNRKLYLVGGCVRDWVLRIPVKDFDLCTDAPPEEIAYIMKKLGANVIDKLGGNYGTVHSVYQENDVEITTFRVDKDYPAGDRRPVVEFSTELKDDLVRRDFTINAMVATFDSVQKRFTLCVEEEIAVKGYKDLHAKVLCTPQEATKLMADDPLRILRMYRFAVRFGLTIDPELRQAARAFACHLKHISRERIQQELVKIARGIQAHEAFRLMMEDGVLQQFMPELAVQVGYDQWNTHHHLPLWEHTLDTVKNAVESASNYRTVLAALLHDVGKPFSCQYYYICQNCTPGSTARNHEAKFHDKVDDMPCWDCAIAGNTQNSKLMRMSFHGHDAVGADMAQEILERLKFSNDDVRDISLMIRGHIKYAQIAYSEEVNKKKLARRYVNEMKHLVWDMLALMRADKKAHAPQYTDTSGFESLAELVLTLDIKEVIENKTLINGVEIQKLLNIGPGKYLGAIIQDLKQAQLDGEVTTVEEAENWVLAFYRG